jgi:hypothetical protein
MIMPGTVGDSGLLVFEDCFCSFLPWLFIYVVFTALTNLLCYQRNPFIEESKHFHY